MEKFSVKIYFPVVEKYPKLSMDMENIQDFCYSVILLSKNNNFSVMVYYVMILILHYHVTSKNFKAIIRIALKSQNVFTPNPKSEHGHLSEIL